MPYQISHLSLYFVILKNTMDKPENQEEEKKTVMKWAVSYVS